MMIGIKGHAFHACMKMHDLGIRKMRRNPKASCDNEKSESFAAAKLLFISGGLSQQSPGEPEKHDYSFDFTDIF